MLLSLSAETITAQIKIKAVGDIMPGSVTPKKILPSGNGNFFADSIGRFLEDADIVFGNLEGTFILDGMKAEKCSEESRAKGICYEFGIPSSIAPVLKNMGFTVLSLDNNHSEDYGEAGYNHTISLLGKLGIHPAKKRSFASIEMMNKKIAVVAFGYSGNSFNISDPDSASKIISELNRVYDFIIVSFHGGAEGRKFQRVTGETEIFLGENRGNVSEFAHTVIDAGADLVLGHGPHVLRGIELYRNKLIAYSLGNFLTYGNMNIKDENGLTIILSVTLDSTSGEFVWGKLIPVKQIEAGYPVFDETYTSLKLIKALSESDFPKSPVFFMSDGHIFPKYIDAPIMPLEKPVRTDFIQ